MSLVDETFGFQAFQAFQFEETEPKLVPSSTESLGFDTFIEFGFEPTQVQKGASQRPINFLARDTAFIEHEKVEATISEDLGDGQSATLDGCLGLLGEDDVLVLIPSNKLDADEIHIIDDAPPGNHALQDYQMQLMLLEQQNKKRLMMARQEQDNVSSRKTRSNMPSRKKIQPRQARKSGKSSQQDLFSYAGSGLGSKRRKRDGPSQDHAHDKELPYHPEAADPIVDNIALAQIMRSCSDVIYQVQCMHDEEGTHSVPAFRDAPVPGAQRDGEDMPEWAEESHLDGLLPIFDLEEYMADDTDGVAFVIIRKVECSEASVLMARSGLPLRWTDDVYIKSKTLKVALQSVATCYFQPVAERKRTYRQHRITRIRLFLFHHRQLLEDYAVLHPTSKHHIDALLEYMNSRYGDDFADADDVLSQGKVTERHIMKLFKPNELVISGTFGRPAAFVVHEWPVLEEDNWLIVNCWSFQTDGSRFTRRKTQLKIHPVGSEVDIQRLAAYPWKFATPELQNTIRAHGKKQWELRNPTQITYKGWNAKHDQYFPEARFMIDHGVYRKMHENAMAFHFEQPETTYPFDRWPAYIEVGQEPSDNALLLLPPVIHGFYLNEKKWIQLFVDCIHPVSWNKRAYERLVLPEQTKDLVRALVTVRTSQRGIKQGIGLAGKRTDITTGKGNGLIMLLHGSPGTGKTLTAESVAEIAEMPLYRVTCGDIGTSAEAVERYLNTVLHLGKIWNCVLLLDEADIFLEERSMSDLKRNSLVSVFLRILEYYDGILILTSNRVGMFDEAFKSRIQVALHYETLNRSSRKKIWQNFIDMLEEDDEDVNFDEIKYHLDDLAGKELNGRQIRNVLTTARQLAIYKNERLEWDHMTQALSVSSDFSAYLKRMQGHTDEQRARDMKLR